jgi:hypothetical protein
MGTREIDTRNENRRTASEIPPSHGFVLADDAPVVNLIEAQATFTLAFEGA